MEEIGNDGSISSTVVITRSHAHIGHSLCHQIKRIVERYMSMLNRIKLIWMTINSNHGVVNGSGFYIMAERHGLITVG